LYASTSASFIGSRALAIVGGLVIVAGLLMVAFPGYSPQGVIEFFFGLPVIGLGMAIFAASCLFDWHERPRAARILGVIFLAMGISAIAAVILRWFIAVGAWQ